MLLLAELISAPELLNQGFILRIYPQAELSAAAITLAQRLESLAPITQKVTKLSLLRLSQSNLPNCDDLIRECYGSADFKTGVAAFLAGENPKWQGQ
jgi:enoyl-CoA hydratase/carnithine racemase